jgi:hypothetical protein
MREDYGTKMDGPDRLASRFPWSVCDGQSKKRRGEAGIHFFHTIKIRLLT